MSARRHRIGDGLQLPGNRVNTRLREEARPIGRALPQMLDDIGPRLSDVDLVVVDLETTGHGSQAAITEIGALRLRGPRTLAEYSTLVNPGQPISPAITSLTGITNAHVLRAPPLGDVIGDFADFVAGAWGLVAHNARFDMGFLRRAWRDAGLKWGDWVIVDTLRLARLILPRPQVANHRLATLAAHFGASHAPCHRALDDARATAEVLQGLIRLGGPYGLTHATDLATLARPVTRARRRNAHLARGLPDSPGIYRFATSTGDIAYIGSATSLRTRVASYFTAAEQRGRIAEMTAHARDLTWRRLPCVAWARVAELREIAAYTPPYNRRSTHPERWWFVELTDEPVARLRLTRSSSPTAVSAGPLPSQTAARRVAEAVRSATSIRSCTQRLDPYPTGLTPCYLAELDRCSAPCLDGVANVAAHRATAAAARMLRGDCAEAVATLCAEIDETSRGLNFEVAADKTRRLEALLAAARTSEATLPVRTARRLVLARRAEVGGWCLSGIRYGRLVARAWAPRTRDLLALKEAFDLSWQRGAHDLDDAPVLWEETRVLADLATQPGTRIVDIDTDAALACSLSGGWSFPQLWETLKRRNRTPGWRGER